MVGTQTFRERFSALEGELLGEMARLRVPGAALGVWDAGAELVGGYGVTNVDHPLPVDGDTLFQIGSITKTMTAVALMRLVERGTLDLDAPVRTYLPGFSMADPETARVVSTRMLLNHSGGWLGDYFDDFGNGDEALALMVDRIGRLPQLTPPGALFSYNNAGFNIASRLLEVLSGKPYERALQEAVFDPLGMELSYFYPDDELLTRRVAAGHETRDCAKTVLREWAIGRAGNGVGGGVLSIRELLKYARFHLRSGVSDGGARIAASETIAAMREPALDAGARGSVGLSWFIRDCGGVRTVYHAGATNGQQAYLLLVPDREFAAAVLTNDDAGGQITGVFRSWILRLWFDAAESDPVRLPATSELVAERQGFYEQPMTAFRLAARDGGLVYLEEPRGGFPRPDSPPGPPLPPMRTEFIAGDRIRIAEGPKAGTVGDFIRGTDGRIAFLRIGGRAIPKVG